MTESTASAEDTFREFQKHWLNAEPAFKLDDPGVREDLMTVLAVIMSLLAVGSPETWATFMQDCKKAASKVPPPLQAKIKGELTPV